MVKYQEKQTRKAGRPAYGGSSAGSGGVSQIMTIEIQMESGIGKSYRVQCMDTQQNYDVSFQRDACPNSYQIQAKYLRECMDYISPRAEEFQVSFESSENGEGELGLLAYTREIVAEREILKQPLQTHLRLSLDQVDEYQVDANAEITVRLKELRTVVSFADALQRETALRCYFYKPGLPVMFELVNPTLPERVEMLFVFIATGYDGEETFEHEAAPARLTKRRRTARSTASLVDSFVLHNTEQPSISAEAQPHAQRAGTVATTITERSQSVGRRMPTDEDMEQPSVVWDSGPITAEPSNGTSSRPSVFRTVSQSLLAGEASDDEEMDQQLTQLADQVANRDQSQSANRADSVALGPTQGASQARGLFD